MFATELIRRTRPFIVRSMSSSVLPWVSGTQKITKNRDANTITAKVQKVPWGKIVAGSRNDRKLIFPTSFATFQSPNTHSTLRGTPSSR